MDAGYEKRPAERFAGAVVWGRVREAAATAPVRVLPDGCTDLIWADGELLVAGPDTGAQMVSGAAGLPYAGLRFAPGRAAVVLGVAAWELRDQRCRWRRCARTAWCARGASASATPSPAARRARRRRS